MAMILDAFMTKCSATLTDFIQEEAIMLLGVKGDLQNLQQHIMNIQSLLKDAERKKFDESSINIWLSQLKDVMYDAEDIIDLCQIEGAQLLSNQNSNSKTSSLCFNFYSCFTSIPLRHEVGSRIKELNSRLNRIYESRKQFKLERFAGGETSQITVIDSRQTSSMVDDVVVGREIEADANELVERLVAENVEEKCRLFAVTGMGGIGKTSLAQKVFNHSKIQIYFKLKVWVCVSQTYSETELLKQVIRGCKGSYGDAKTKSELLQCLRDSVVSGNNLFLVLDDVWRADVWVELLRVSLHAANASVRVLVTTRYEDVAREMEAARTQIVTNLSMESCWDVLRGRLFKEGQEELANELKELGFEIVEKCGRLPLAIKAISGVLARKERNRKEWEKVIRNNAWSMKNLPEELKGALYLSFEDLPSHLKQCFLYFALYPEDAELSRRDFTRLWVAEGFVMDQQDSLMEDSAEEYFNELLRRNLLLPDPSDLLGKTCKMHDLIRSLVLFLSKDETFSGDLNQRNSTTSTKFRRLSVAHESAATEILDSIADQGALRTLLASKSHLFLNDERLSRLSHLRVLQIKKTEIQILPDSIGKLVHLRYLDLDGTNIREIPESIDQLTNLQFLNIRACRYLTKLPSGITRLHNLRRLGLFNTPISFIPKGIKKLHKLNDLSGFVVSNNESSSKLEELNHLKQIRMLSVCNLERAQSGAIFLCDLPCLTDLKLYFSENNSDQVEVEKMFDELKPPSCLEEFKITGFFGCCFPYWMQLSTFEKCVPFLTRLEFVDIISCSQLPPLGQLPELRLLTIKNASQVKKIGQEFLGGGFNSSTRIVFPKLEILIIHNMPKLEEWCFGAQIEQNVSAMLKLFPCLQELSIGDCPLLKQLPKGLKHSAMKSLFVERANSLKTIDDLPIEIEVLQVGFNENLENICCVPALKRLLVIYCAALSCVEEIDSLQELMFFDFNRERLPDWLLKILHQQVVQSKSKELLLQLQCSEKALCGCVQGGSHWELIKQIPRVIAYEDNPFGTGYLRYTKQPYVYDTNL